MARRIDFGNTWWGKAWVEALHNIDEDINRLPRGRSYARNGSVLDVNLLKNGSLKARVEGRQALPYKVDISLQPFSESEKRAVGTLLQQRPDLAGQILVGSLPKELDGALQEVGVQLFPKSWQQIKGDCSCPDWANPCKHLAAVYYVLANEIDKDPFLLFALHGLTKHELLGFAQGATGTQEKDQFVEFHEDVPYQESNLTAPEIDSTYMGDKLLSALEDNPLFYPQGNFKQVLKQGYKRVAEGVGSETVSVEGEQLSNVTWHIQYSKANPQFVWNSGAGDQVFSPREVLRRFADKPLGKKQWDPCEITFLKQTILFINKLALSGLYIPHAQKIDESNSFVIRYMPTLADPAVESYIDYLCSLAFAGVVRDGNKRVMPRKQGVLYCVSLLLTALVVESYPNLYHNSISGCFFAGKVYDVTRFEERQTYTSVSNWLEILSFQRKRFTMAIRIEPNSATSYQLELGVKDRANPLDVIAPLKTFTRGSSHNEDVVKQVGVLARYSKIFAQAVQNESGSVEISGEQLADFLTTTLPVLKTLGITTVLPKEMYNLLRPKLQLTATANGKTGESFLNIDEITRFQWRVALGDQPLTDDEVRLLLKASQGVVKLRDQYVILDPAELKSILTNMDKEVTPPKGLALVRELLSGQHLGYELQVDKTLQTLLDELKKVRSIHLPKKLNAKLRPYQRRGYQWLVTNLDKGLGVCLADDMGLGKTLQAIAAILKYKERGELDLPALIVCPTTLVGNWLKECQKFAPTLEVSIYHGTNRKLCMDSDVIITSYGLVRNDLAELKKHQWTCVVIDEAQNIKNADALQSKAVKALQAKGRIAITGTPMENRLLELWSIFDFMLPKYLGSQKQFVEKFAVPIERLNQKSPAQKLQQSIEPFLLRRLKTDKKVIKDLPDKVVTNEYVYLQPEQAALYQQVVGGLSADAFHEDRFERARQVLGLLTALKQICNHPVNYSKHGDPDSTLSGKSMKTIELLQAIMEQGEKAILFTQYREMGALLEQMIAKELNVRPLFFHGGLAQPVREQLVEEFQTNDRVPIMILSLKAGGSGLNLTAANHVIHYDLWWNPAVESQATDRAFRIGQQKNVQVHRLITLNTFEEKIDELLSKKRIMVDQVIQAGERWITDLSDQELVELLTAPEKGEKRSNAAS